MSETETSRGSAKSKSLFWLVLVVAAFALAADLLTKRWALSNLSETEDRPFLGDFLTFRLVHNSGAAFSLGESSTWIFTMLSAAIAGFMIWYATRLKSKWAAVIVGFILGGAIGNLFDRLTQPPGFGRGHVIDFINYNGWFVGNVADIWIVLGAVAIVILLMLQPEPSRATGQSVSETPIDE